MFKGMNGERLVRIAALLLLAAAPLACAQTSAGSKFAPGAQVHYPAWIVRGSGPGSNADGRAFFGVGQVSGMRNVALARSTADNRARAELARVLDAYYAALLAEWSQAQSGKGSTIGTDEQGQLSGTIDQVASQQPSSEQLLKSLSAAALPSVQIAEHWFHPDEGSVFSEARLALAQMHDFVGRSHDLPLPLRDWLQEHMDNTHQAMLARHQEENPAAAAPAVAPKEPL